MRRPHVRGELRGDHVATVRARIVVTESGCWEYQGPRIRGGYGQVGRNRMAHRVMWEAVHGAIAEGLHLDHLCRNPPCVNPDHLEPVTPRVNLLRGTGFSAVNAAKEECGAGHPYDATNTYVSPMGRRQCRTCRREANRRATRKNGRYAPGEVARIRAWAVAQGISVASKGRIPAPVIDAYRAAHPEAGAA